MNKELSTQINSLIESIPDLGDKQHSEITASVQVLLSEALLHKKVTWAAHMTPETGSAALLGNLIAAHHNGNLLSANLYPQLAEIEAQLISWLCQPFYKQHGHFTHGSSYGNLEALWHAREHNKSSSNIVYGSSATHYSVAKACRILGLEFRAITTDSVGKIETDALQTACKQNPPLAIVATVGTSSSGAIDSLERCANIADDLNCWLHIDAAWGGALAFLEGQTMLTGIERADSLCFDPHKALGLPKPCSVILYQQPLESFTDIEADYLSQTPKKTLAGSYGGELFLSLWFRLLCNKDGIISEVYNRLEQAQLFANKLKDKTDWTIWHSPTGIVCFAPNNDKERLALENITTFSNAKINNQPVFRAVFASTTTKADALFTELEPYL